MKKLIIAFVALFTMTVTTSAMGYEQAREQALFLTDKMAYELNLTEAQYEAAYEVNLDYLMGVNSYDDVYGTYWTRRNLDLSYILMDWQYQAFVNATYFYRPLWWEGGYWHFGIYARYPHRDYFYFGRPHFYAEYRGGHSWHHNGGRSWYHGRDFAGPGPQNGRQNGMRNGFERGDYRGNGNNRQNNRTFGNGQRPNTSANGQGNRNFGNNNGGQRPTTGTQRPATGTQQQQPSRNQSVFGGARSTTRQSSTRTTVTRPQNSGSTFGGTRTTTTQPRQSFTPSRSSSVTPSRTTSAPSRSTSSFGSSRSGGGSSFGGSHTGGGSRSTGGGARSGGGSFGGRR